MRETRVRDNFPLFSTNLTFFDENKTNCNVDSLRILNTKKLQKRDMRDPCHYNLASHTNEVLVKLIFLKT